MIRSRLDSSPVLPGRRATLQELFSAKWRPAVNESNFLKKPFPGYLALRHLSKQVEGFSFMRQSGPLDRWVLFLRTIDLGAPPDFDKAFEAALHDRAEALVVLVSSVTYAHRAKIAGLAIENRLPAIAPFNEFVDDGG